MRINELFEEGGKHVTFCFGRMNPPTIGHEQVFKTMASVGGEFKIFVSQSQDKKDNPLDYATKIKFIKAIHKQYAENVVSDSSLNTVVKVASHLYDLGYRNATFVAGSDRIEQFKKLLSQYNGVEGKAHGYYKFDVLDFVSSGEREDGAEGVAGVSASGARAAAANGDLEAFTQATGAGQYAKPMYGAVRKGMGISEMQEANPNQQISLYKPDGKTYRQEPMPTLDKDPVDDADSLDVLKNEPYETDFSKEEIKRIILKHLENLDDKEKKVLKARYWLEMTLDEVSKAMKVSSERIRQIEAKAMRKLRLSFNKSKEYDFEHMSEGYGRYYCSTDKKWKTRKGPKQKRSS
jgi:RNA polymerase sigma factor (sigma-70 family)